MATWRQHLINESTTAIAELAKLIRYATEHSEEEYSDSRFAEDLEEIAEKLRGWKEQIGED